MKQYAAFHCTALGYSHVLKNICCEDASISYSGDAIHIAVVADGHGDKACFRSQTGAQMAVDIASAQLKSFADTITQENWTEDLLQKENQEKLIRQLIRSIMGNWTIQVLQDLEDHPITEEELQMSGIYEDRYRAGAELPHIYGCTLIAALITDAYLLVLHQGDGRCIIIHEDGHADQPVPWDDLCVGNVCTSLCHEDAAERCRYYLSDLSKDRIAACFLTTDGVEDSLESLDDVNAFFCKLASLCVQEGIDTISAYLSEFLPKMSRSGSADDASIAGFADVQALEGMSEKLELIHQLSVCETISRNAREKLSSMQRKMEYLRNRLRAAETKWQSFQEPGMEHRMHRLWESVMDYIYPDEEPESNAEEAVARNAYETAKAEFNAYFEKWSEHEERALNAEQQAAQIRQLLAQTEQSDCPNPCSNTKPHVDLAEDPVLSNSADCFE